MKAVGIALCAGLGWVLIVGVAGAVDKHVIGAATSSVFPEAKHWQTDEPLGAPVVFDYEDNGVPPQLFDIQPDPNSSPVFPADQVIGISVSWIDVGDNCDHISWMSQTVTCRSLGYHREYLFEAGYPDQCNSFGGGTSLYGYQPGYYEVYFQVVDKWGRMTFAETHFLVVEP